MDKIKVIELFAGVGGFRIGLDRVEGNSFETIWSNQFEPSTKIQHASQIYTTRFGTVGHANEDISLVKTSEIPDHDMLVGGFPCQDYSVARTLSQSSGIVGKKGVLWWDICRIIRDKGAKKPKVLFLENVDRLLISPVNQKGRDFAIILASLCELGYVVEWRVINAAEYGMPQRRRRTYILAYSTDSQIAQTVAEPTEWIFNDGVFAKSFPVLDYNGITPLKASSLYAENRRSLEDISADFNSKGMKRPFENAGVMKDGEYWTFKTVPNFLGKQITLGDLIVRGDDRKYITEDYFITDEDKPKWEYLKGAKHEPRTRKDGGVFYYNEGGMNFPDSLEKPSRTIITSEGGKTASRFKHVIVDETGRWRRLTPIELERLNMFPDNHTLGANDTKRAFFMGNALVCGVITKVGEEIVNKLKGED